MHLLPPLIAMGGAISFGKDAHTLTPHLDHFRRAPWRALRMLRALIVAARHQSATPLARCQFTGLAFAKTLRWLPAWLGIWLALVQSARAEIELPSADARAGVSVRAESASRWRQGSYDVWHLRGRCQLSQGAVTAEGREAVLWIDRAAPSSDRPHKIIVYFEGDVSVDYARDGAVHRVTGREAQTIAGRWWLGRFHTTGSIDMHVPLTTGRPSVMPAVFQRGMQARRPASAESVQPAQFVDPRMTPPSAASPSSQIRRITVTPRSSVRVQAQTFVDSQRGEQMALIDSGVRIVVESDATLGTVTIETDRLVIWTSADAGQDFSQEALQSGDSPLEFYMEGNIVFLQGDRVIYAQRMYYNVPQRYGVVLDAEMLTPVPEYQGMLRLKAEVLQQIDEQNFLAYNGAITSSRIGLPRYWFQSERIEFQDVQTPLVDPLTGQPTIDPQTGGPAIDHQFRATSRNNFLFVGGLPVFYWPVLAADLNKSNYYINRLTIKNDSVFGTQLLTDWDMYQLLGIRNPPAGTEWDVTLDLLSRRGVAVGTNFNYQRESLFGFPGLQRGQLDLWGIDDQGLDNLGADRRALLPEEDLRGRALWQHRHYLANGYQLTGEVGLVSDRNFLEQFYEREWDQYKDQTTGVELKQLRDNTSWAITADVRLNDFFTQTEWLPRLDHYTLGQSVFWDRFTWYEHSHAGYARLRTASPPINAIDGAKFDPLAWEVARQGLRAGTRQEIDLPLPAGPVKLVPYLLGDLTYWQQDLAAADLTRAYGQVGLRASLPMWKTNPAVQSTLLNVNGLAHKVVFDGEVLWADGSQDLSRLPLYDPLDDDSQEHFRRRFFFDTFGGTAGGDVPLAFDERYYALRSGLQSSVASPSAEVADDLLLARLAVRQRWQTKRGLPGQQRIVDVMVLDLEGALFPKPGRDNFGQELGLVNYDFRWHVGDRLALLSDGYADVFGDGLRTVSFGGLMNRPGLGNVYLGYRVIEGPTSSNIISGSVNYRMSEKWIATAGAAVDLGPTGNIGQNISFTRIGESALVRIGFNIDASRGNVGVVFSIEPRFLPNNRLGQVGGVQIPPAGALGLE